MGQQTRFGESRQERGRVVPERQKCQKLGFDCQILVPNVISQVYFLPKGLGW